MSVGCGRLAEGNGHNTANLAGSQLCLRFCCCCCCFATVTILFFFMMLSGPICGIAVQGSLWISVAWLYKPCSLTLEKRAHLQFMQAVSVGRKWTHLKKLCQQSHSGRIGHTCKLHNLSLEELDTLAQTKNKVSTLADCTNNLTSRGEKVDTLANYAQSIFEKQIGHTCKNRLSLFLRKN